MTRYTRRTPQGVQVSPQALPAALEQLARFEDAYEALLRQRAELSAQMEPLNAAGKQKSARFRELLGKKLVNQQILLQLEFCGISEGDEEG